MHYRRSFRPLSLREYTMYETYLTKQFNPTNLVTFNFNQPGKWNLANSIERLDAFSDKIDFWLKNKTSYRTQFFAVPEHIGTNLHYHAMVRTPDPVKFEKVAPQLWELLVNAGQLYFKPDKLTPQYVEHFGHYMLKEYWQGTPVDTYYASKGSK